MTILLTTFLSFIFSTAYTKMIFWCFDWDFTYKIALGVWLLQCMFICLFSVGVKDHEA